MKRVKVRVPATSANLGPGFDCVGCAWALYDELTLSVAEAGLEIRGDDPRFWNEHNLIVRGFRAAEKALGLPPRGIRAELTRRIPLSHGLGSSASMIVLGAAAANALAGSPLTREDLLRVCNPIEGHPDNLAPAIFGGVTASIVDDGVPVTVRYAMSERIRALALIPDFDLSTQLARSVLPDHVSRADSIFNTAHTAVLLKALELGDGALIRAAQKDRLHQPYRAGLIENYADLQRAALDCGSDGFCISGAGPTLLCLYTDERFPRRMAEPLADFPRWKAVALAPDLAGFQAE